MRASAGPERARGTERRACARNPAASVGQRVLRLDGAPKLTGEAIFGDDGAPADALWLKAVRSPARARAFFHRRSRAVSASAIPASSAFSRPAMCRAKIPSASIPISRTSRFSPKASVRYRGEPVLAAGGHARSCRGGCRRRTFRSPGSRCRRCTASQAALADGAPAIHAEQARQRPDQRPRRVRQTLTRAWATADAYRGGHVRNVVRRARLHRARSRLRQARRRPHGGLCLHPGADDGSRRGRPRARPAARESPHRAHGLRRRLRRQARCRRAADAGGRGLAPRPAGAVRLRAHRVDGLHHQATSRQHSGARELRLLPAGW